MNPDELATLARRQGATHILAVDGAEGRSLERLRVEGRWAIYRLRAEVGSPPGRAWRSGRDSHPLILAVQARNSTTSEPSGSSPTVTSPYSFGSTPWLAE